MRKLNDGHFVEALDRLHIIQGMINELLVDHPAIIASEVNEEANSACLKLGEMYQKVGAAACDFEEVK